MNRQGKMLELAAKSKELIYKVINGEGNDTVITNILWNQWENAVIFEMKKGYSIEYNLSEISCIFEDDVDGLEIFSKKKYLSIFNELRNVQLETEQL